MFFLQPKSTAAFYDGSNMTFALRQSSPDIGHSYYVLFVTEGPATGRTAPRYPIGVTLPYYT